MIPFIAIVQGPGRPRIAPSTSEEHQSMNDVPLPVRLQSAIHTMESSYIRTASKAAEERAVLEALTDALAETCRQPECKPPAHVLAAMFRTVHDRFLECGLGSQAFAEIIGRLQARGLFGLPLLDAIYDELKKIGKQVTTANPSDEFATPAPDQVAGTTSPRPSQGQPFPASPPVSIDPKTLHAECRGNNVPSGIIDDGRPFDNTLPPLHAGLTYPKDEKLLSFLGRYAKYALRALLGTGEEIATRDQRFESLRIRARQHSFSDQELIRCILLFAEIPKMTPDLLVEAVQSSILAASHTHRSLEETSSAIKPLAESEFASIRYTSAKSVELIASIMHSDNGLTPEERLHRIQQIIHRTATPLPTSHKTPEVFGRTHQSQS